MRAARMTGVLMKRRVRAAFNIQNDALFLRVLYDVENIHRSSSSFVDFTIWLVIIITATTTKPIKKCACTSEGHFEIIHTY